MAKSVGNRCVIEVLVAFLCCRVAFWIFSVGVGAESDFFLFSSIFVFTDYYFLISKIRVF